MAAIVKAEEVEVAMLNHALTHAPITAA